MMYPLVRDLAEQRVRVTTSCEVLGFSTAGYYRWAADPVTDRDWDDAHLVQVLRGVHADDPAFGYRLMSDELADAGHVASENRVHRLCREHEIWSTIVRKGRKSGKSPGPAVHDDLVMRHFHAEQPDTVWLTDITEHPTAEGNLYLCAIKDVCSRRIVGYAIGPRMTADLAADALRTAIHRRQPSRGLIVHSDRGSQFRTRKFRNVLRQHHLRGSMGRVASAGDNAAMESFFALLQRNVLDRHHWETREDLRIAMIVWMAKTYNRRRRQRALGKLSLVAYELMLADNQTLAA